MSAAHNNSPTSPATRHHLKISTTPLYGVLASRKSYLVGLRCLVKSHHALFLARKICASRLPTELVELITAQLVRLEHCGVQERWAGMRGPEGMEKVEKIFGMLRPMGDIGLLRNSERVKKSSAETAAGRELAALGVSVVEVDVSRPGKKAGARYVHLCAGARRPEVAMNVPYPGVRFVEAALHATEVVSYAMGRGIAIASCKPDRLSGGTGAAKLVDLSSDSIEVSSAAHGLGEEVAGKPVSRLLQLGDVESVIREWDQEAVERFVALLGLKVICVDGEEGGGLRPALRLLQVMKER